MPQYQLYFDTNEGEKKFKVDIDDSESLEKVLSELIAELTERGHRLRGVSTGDLKVIWNSRELDLSRSLPEQQVQPFDVLRVLVENYIVGGHSLRRDRIEQEWMLLQKLEKMNPESVEILDRRNRLTDETIYVKLLHSPGVEAIGRRAPVIRSEHTVRLCFPRFYPDVPIECYVKEPLIHPNVRVETGFVCLWERFGLGDTAIQAVCRTQSMAAYRLVNLNQVHVMNHEAAQWYSEVAKVQGLVPLSWDELSIFEIVSGRLSWLEPSRMMRPSLRRWAPI